MQPNHSLKSKEITKHRLPNMSTTYKGVWATKIQDLITIYNQITLKHLKETKDPENSQIHPRT